MDDDFEMLPDANLRAAFDVWRGPVPQSAEELAQLAVQVVVRDLLLGRAGRVNVVRVAPDGVSDWRIDRLHHVTLDDFVRAIGGVHEPVAHALAVVQPTFAGTDPRMRGVHVVAAFGTEAMIELKGEISGWDGPPEGRAIPEWMMRLGRANPGRGWVGVPPDRPLKFPMLGAGDA